LISLRTATLTLAIALSAPAHAGELKVISAGAVRGVIGGMIDDYSRRSGIKFDFTVGPTGLLRDTIASGKPADLIIASAPLMAELEQTGKIAPGSRADIGRLGLGVVVRAGTPAPDISTPEAVKQALVNAKSIAYTDPKLGGTSVLHLMKFAETMGIKDEVVRKGVPATGGNDATAKVAEGKADISVVLMSEVHAKEARLVGPLPEPIQLWTVYSAAIPVSSTDPAAARAFIAALTAPEMREHWIKAGWQPAN
jgi:molybdate transport system substrate-binding protein